MDAGKQLAVRSLEFLPHSIKLSRGGCKQVRHVIADLHPHGVAVEGVVLDADDARVHIHTHRRIGDVHLVTRLQVGHFEKRNFVRLRIFPAVNGHSQIGHILTVH